MEPIVLKVYDTDVERIGEIVQQVGYLMIVENKINLSKVEVTYYNAVYIPKSCTGLISTFQSRITAYDNLLQCMLHFDKEGYYLKSKDMQQFTNIAKLQFKQIFEKITDWKTNTKTIPCCKCGGNILHFYHPEEEEFYCEKCFDKYLSEEENTIFCVKCGKDPGGSFFRLSDGPYCLECYRDNFCCSKGTAIPETTPENPDIETDTCCKCQKTYPINTMHLNPLAETRECHKCYYDLLED